MYKVARFNRNWFLLRRHENRYGIVIISPYLDEIMVKMEEMEDYKNDNINCYDCNDTGIVWRGDYDNMVEVKCHCKL